MPRGATKQFDRTEALDRAMQLFWEKGYEATGLSELTERMGIGRQSLYDTFGDKKSLFLEALDHYEETELGRLRDQLGAPGSAIENIRGVLTIFDQHNTCGNGLGCLLVNAMAESGGTDPSFEEPIRRKAKALETMFRKAFDAAKEAGEIRPDADTLALARTMCALAFGLTVMGRIGLSRAVVRDAIRMNTRIIDSVLASP